MKLLSYCGALAAGEFIASFFPNYADAWPAAAVVAILCVLFGHGCNICGWRHLSMLLVGIVLFFHASTESEQLYREKPWLRGHEKPAQGSDANQLSQGAWLKKDLSRRLGIGLDNDYETVALERAILLGERQRLPRKLKRLFTESGTMHVFAISGLHVMAIAEVLTIMLAFVLVPRRLAGLLSTPILWGYVYLIGCPPSAVRAAMMATFSFLAPVFWRRPNGLRSWTLTFLLVHLTNPLMISNVGNMMSFAVMLAVVLVGDASKHLSKFWQALAMTVGTWAMGVPIAAHVFGRVTPGGMLANLVLIAAARLTVVAGAVGISISYLSETIAVHLNNFSALGVHAMVFVAELVSRLPGANFETGSWSMLMCVEWYAAIGLIVWLAQRLYRRRRTLL